MADGGDGPRTRIAAPWERTGATHFRFLNRCVFLGLAAAWWVALRAPGRAPRLAATLGVDGKNAVLDAAALRRPLPRVFGHRGSLYEEPENTLPSFRRALEAGANLELDVFLLKDGSLVVFHGGGGDVRPGRLKGYFGVPGSIMDLTLDEARRLRFGGPVLVCPEERWAGATIPLLEEVLQVVKDHSDTAEVKIELKGPDTELPVLELVERMDLVDRCSYISFHLERLAKVRELRPQRRDDGSYAYRTGGLWSRVPEGHLTLARDAGLTEVQLRYDQCTRARVDAIHAAGFNSTCWFRGPSAMRWDAARFRDFSDEDGRVYTMLLQSGVQAMTVNRPGRLVQFLSDLREQYQE